MKNCDKCGAANQDEADFCGLCMTPFPNVDQSNAASASGHNQPPGPPPVYEAPASTAHPESDEPPKPTNIYEEMQAGVIIDGSRTVSPGGPSAQGLSRPGVPATVASVSDAIRERTTELRSSLELFNDTFFFWWNHAFFFLAMALSIIVIRIALWGYLLSRVFGSLATTDPNMSEPSLIAIVVSWLLKAVAVEGFVYVLGYATFSIVTVKFAQGYGASVMAALIAGLISLRHTLWIMLLQGLFIMVAPLPAVLLVSATLDASLFASFLTNAATLIIAATSAALFTIAIFVVLDQEIHGPRALSVAWELLRSNLPGVVWRLVALGSMMSVLVLGTMLSPVGAIISIGFVPAGTIIYAWMIYKNLKDMKEAREFRLRREAAQATLTPA